MIRLNKPSALHRTCRLALHKQATKVKHNVGKTLSVGLMSVATVAPLANATSRANLIEEVSKISSYIMSSINKKPVPTINFTEAHKSLTDTVQTFFTRHIPHKNKLVEQVFYNVPSKPSIEKNMVLKIMNEDKAVLDHVDKDLIASTIVQTAKEIGIDPIVLTCIAKRESHFSGVAYNGTGHGVMQLVPITVKDMYQRKHLYHSSFEKIAEEYPTNKLLFDAIKKMPQLNIKVGAIVFLSKLDKAKGNLRQCLKFYNASPHQDVYSKEVFADIAKYKKEYAKIEDYYKSLTTPNWTFHKFEPILPLGKKN